MRIASITACFAAGVLASAAGATQAVGYRLASGSQMTERFCLPPCLCPYHESTGPTAGTFTLEQTLVDPLFTHYSVTGLHLVSVINGADVVIDGYGSYRRGGEVAIQQQLVLDVTVNGVPAHYDSGLVAADAGHPYPQISITAMTAVASCRQDVLTIIAAPDVTVCYANCDDSNVPPILNANDFQCFMNAFAAGNLYANCDGSTADPVLNANDFQCFLNRFARACQ